MTLNSGLVHFDKTGNSLVSTTFIGDGQSYNSNITGFATDPVRFKITSFDLNGAALNSVENTNMTEVIELNKPDLVTEHFHAVVGVLNKK